VCSCCLCKGGVECIKCQLLLSMNPRVCLSVTWLHTTSLSDEQTQLNWSTSYLEWRLLGPRNMVLGGGSRSHPRRWGTTGGKLRALYAKERLTGATCCLGWRFLETKTHCIRWRSRSSSVRKVGFEIWCGLTLTTCLIRLFCLNLCNTYKVCSFTVLYKGISSWCWDMPCT